MDPVLIVILGLVILVWWMTKKEGEAHSAQMKEADYWYMTKEERDAEDEQA